MLGTIDEIMPVCGQSLSWQTKGLCVVYEMSIIEEDL